jgi:Trk K+ transport system NAD-binding subunit
VLVSIRRGSRLIIPHGDSCLQGGDVVTALCEQGCQLDVSYILNAVTPTSEE